MVRVSRDRIFDLAKELGPELTLLVEIVYLSNPTVQGSVLNSTKIAEALSISTSTVNRLIKKLVELGYLDKHSRSTYALTYRFYTLHKKFTCYDYL